ncbi:MAG: hypothetical protein HLUCCX14_08650 [Marinobacter excellens HL-55]|uniref:DUF4864 domain-containing protein n=1 Tax=Marinobacter excellens HL-55 TaxID=1305731 RepID=A0A0P8BKQ3_9GAMM|nr:MAG: hypothetical protein HLUCCX14_08650 [Marinobacter excellens HL-55]
MGLKGINISKAAVLVVIGVVAMALLWSPRPMASDADEQIRDAILSQIEAFANNDGDQAWAHASEGIQRRFGSSQVFLNMVREAYPAVHSATAIEFTERVPHGSFDIQTVRLQGPEGKRWDAYYRMEQGDGAWKIAGVRLQPADPGI